MLELLPEELAEYLKEIYDLNRSRNEQILNQLEEITTVLNKSNIYPIWYIQQFESYAQFFTRK